MKAKRRSNRRLLGVGALSGAGVLGLALTAVAYAQPPAGQGDPSSQAQLLRRALEDHMGSIGNMASQANQNDDVVQASCVLDKRGQAQSVMELATGEYLVTQDGGASSEDRALALEKLRAAVESLSALVDDAKRCQGDLDPEDEADATRNEADEPTQTPSVDPTVPPSPTQPPVPNVDDSRPPAVASPVR